jgi:septum formation protein
MAVEVLLASGSSARAEMLAAAGVHCLVQVAAVDEAALKRQARARGCDGATTALLLAGAKAAAVSRLRPEALVIGADQMLVCEGVWLDKPQTPAEVVAQLRWLRGRWHRLISAASCWQYGKERWHGVAHADLRMRRFSESFLAAYAKSEAEAVTGALGGYHIEGMGMQLFTAVRGQTSVIRGLPLVRLLGFLRHVGVLPR